ncbi:MAG: DUF1877 family protein, partial [Planctomycetaceae bacterium]|nr:DUF1877 family protein [Planctomycetaceae bacterium]
MAGLGVHFALTDEESQRLLAADGNQGVLAVVEQLEDGAGERAFDSERAWDALHRCLSNGTIYYDEGDYPLNRAVLGGKHLYDGDDFVAAYVSPDEVKDVAAALAPISEQDLRKRYDAIDPDDYDGEHGEADFRIILTAFLGMR